MHYRARAYMPEIGRFMQEDPHPGKMTLPRSLTSKYIYSLNNPINRVDPSGEISFKDVVFTVAIIALTVYTGGLAGAYVGSAAGTGFAGAIAGGFAGAIVGAVVGHFAGGALNVLLGRGSFADGANEGMAIGVTSGAIAGFFAGYQGIGSSREPAMNTSEADNTAGGFSAGDGGNIDDCTWINLFKFGQGVYETKKYTDPFEIIKLGVKKMFSIEDAHAPDGASKTISSGGCR